MIKIKTLLTIAVAMLPMVVISSVYNESETNFNLQEKVEQPDMRILSKSDDAYQYEECFDIGDISYKQEDYVIRVLRDNGVVNVPLDEYAIGVVAGEMPASFSIEALKAQAVAGRTYALYRKMNSKNRSYDVTDDTRTQMYIDKNQMQKKWGDTFDKYYNKIVEAVEDTKGEVITYNGEIIEAFYSAMSSGYTQNAMSVFNVSRDYLQPVESEYDNASINGYEVTREYTYEKIIKNLGLSCNKVTVDSVKYNDEGYVKTASICGKQFNGPTFGNKLGLRSANFAITNTGKSIKITTRGFGHGVGMSQYGANGYAEAGYTYQDILKHYYTGVEITELKNL